MDWILPLIGGLGIGSLLKGAVDYVLADRAKLNDRHYQEKRETYLGMIEATHEADIHPSTENAKAFGNWTNRCKLFGSPEVIDAAQEYICASNDVAGAARERAFEKLFRAMRVDMRR